MLFAIFIDLQFLLFFLGCLLGLQLLVFFVDDVNVLPVLHVLRPLFLFFLLFSLLLWFHDLKINLSLLLCRKAALALTHRGIEPSGIPWQRKLCFGGKLSLLLSDRFS